MSQDVASLDIAAAPKDLEFSSWAVYDSFDTAYQEGAIFNKGETIARILDAGGGKLKAYTIATKTLSGDLSADVLATLGFGDAWYHRDQSIEGTYIAEKDAAGSNLLIYKDGALKQKIGNVALGLNATTLLQPTVSKSGQYIAIAGTRTASGLAGLVILKGS